MNNLLNNIETIKEMLDTLPKNNQKNIDKYLSIVNEKLEEYNVYKKEILNEIKFRRNKIKSKINSVDTKSLEEEITDYEDVLYLTSKYNTPYEKLGLDKCIYNISRYYKSNLMLVNNNIKEALNIFEKVGVKLTKENFNYGYYSNKYMEIVFDNINNLENEKVSNIFSELYWKSSDLLMHIELNFKYLYYKNIKKFNNYINKETKTKLSKISDSNIWNRYYYLKGSLIDKKESDISLILDKFNKKELMITDYSKEKIDDLLDNLMNNNTLDTTTIDNMKKFKYSILEYNKYLNVLYIIDEIKNLYKDKKSYKNLVKNELKIIKKNECKLFKLNKKISKLIKNQKKIDNEIIEQNSILISLKENYDNLENDNFKEKNLLLNDSSSLFNIIQLVNDNYTSLLKIIKKANPEITEEELKYKTNYISKLVKNPNIKFMKSINIIDEKDIKMIISDCYKLSNFKVNIETFENESELENIVNNIDKILIYNTIENSSVKIEDIKFYCDTETLEIC